MSMENAILELAAAMTKLANANLACAAATEASNGAYRAALGAYSAATNTGSGNRLVTTDAELETAITKVEDAAKAEQKKVMALVEADRKAAKAGVQAALDKAAAEKAKSVEDDPLGTDVELDWAKDVRPALVSVGKDKAVLVELMTKYQVPKGGQAPVELWPALLAEANAILAARG